MNDNISNCANAIATFLRTKFKPEDRLLVLAKVSQILSSEQTLSGSDTKPDWIDRLYLKKYLPVVAFIERTSKYNIHRKQTGHEENL